MKKFIYIFFSLAILASAGFIFYNVRNTAPCYSPPSTKAERVIVSPELNSQFISLRFENIGEKQINGIQTIPAENLEDCLKYLANNHYHFLSAKEVYDFFANKVPVPVSSVWLSFDEGMKSAWTEVTPLLKKYKARATLFIAIFWIKNNYRLTNNQLYKMNKSGVWDIQTHGYTGGINSPLNKKGLTGNFYLNRLWQIDRVETLDEYKDRITKDMKQASLYLKKNFKIENLLFAYPFGESLDHVKSDIRTAFLEGLEQSGVVGIGRDYSKTIYADFSIKKHFSSRYTLSKYTDIETILSVNFSGKRISFTDSNNKTHIFDHITPYQNGDYLCWNDTGTFAFADSSFKITGNLFSVKDYYLERSKNQKTEFQSHFLCTASGENFLIADNAKGILLLLGPEKNLVKRMSFSKLLKGLWFFDNKLYLFDNRGMIYRMDSSPVHVFDTKISGESLSACAIGEEAFIFDSSQKVIYKVDFIKGKFLEKNSYPKDFCLTAQYALSSTKLVCRDTERNIFLTVEIKSEKGK